MDDVDSGWKRHVLVKSEILHDYLPAVWQLALQDNLLPSGLKV